MATAYTSLLGLALPVTGELSGTWGNTVNTEITSLLDSAISGTTTISADADITLTTTTGAANEAREAIILWTAGGTATRNITAPAQSKAYIVINASSSTQSIVLRGAGPTTGVTIIKGEAAVCAWNGTDFIKVSNISGAGVFSSLTVTGTTTLSGLTASTALALDASKNVVSVTNTGTGNNVLSASPTLTGTVAGASLSLSSLTSGRVPFATTAGLLTDSANLQYSGTDLSVYGLTLGRGAGAVATNTAVGASALGANTTGNNNAALGSGALQSNTTASNNTAVGYQAAYANTTGAQITALGHTALSTNTTGVNNVAVGYQALQLNTTANNNVAVGTTALQATTTGGNNTAIGHAALVANTTGTYNTAVGYGALDANTTGLSNNAFGFDALGGVTTGSRNNGFGVDALKGATTGTYNTAIGHGAGYLITTGSKNTIIGAYTGNQGGLDIRTASNYIVLSDGDGVVRQVIDSSGNVGIGTSSPTSTLSVTGTANVTGNVTLGDATTDTVTVNGYMGVGGSPVQQQAITIGATAVLSGATTAASIRATSTLGSGVTVNGAGINANVRTEAAAFTMALGTSFYAGDATKGAGSTITNLHGLYIVDQTQGTNNYGVTSLVSSGTNKWNIYASGTANNYFAGNVGIGGVASLYPLEVTGTTANTLVLRNTTESVATDVLGLRFATGTSGSALSSANILAGIEVDITQATPSVLQSALTFSTNAGDSFTEKMRIDSSGNLMVGTTTSGSKLTVVGAAAGMAGYFTDSTNSSLAIATLLGGVTLGTDGGGAIHLATDGATAAKRRLSIDATGIVTMSAYGAGAATFSAAGVISSVSDETWKIKDGVPVDVDAMLNKLEPGYWYYNNEKKETFGTDRQLGFYAQNVNAAIGPEAAPVPEEGKPWGYYDRSVLAVTVMSLQKALATIESLTTRIAALEST